MSLTGTILYELRFCKSGPGFSAEFPDETPIGLRKRRAGRTFPENSRKRPEIVSPAIEFSAFARYIAVRNIPFDEIGKQEELRPWIRSPAAI